MRIIDCGWALLGSTDRSDGNAKERGFMTHLIQSAPLPPSTLWAYGDQVHADHVSVVQGFKSSQYFSATDALVTNEPGWILGVYHGDCVPVYLFDEVTHAIGMVHVGWRGMILDIVAKTILKMQHLYRVSPLNLKARLGDHIRVCCYEIGQELTSRFSKQSVVERKGQFFLNLEDLLVNRLVALGLLKSNIISEGSCTACSDGFFSYRRDKAPERMLSFILRKNS